MRRCEDMELIEAVDKYYVDNNKDKLYENVVKSHVHMNEMETVLKDTLGKEYSYTTLLKVATDYLHKITRGIPSREATDEDFR